MIKRILLPIALAAFSFSASADLLKSDWKASGDSRVVLDESTGIEWLNLAETKTLAYDSFVNGQYDEFEGWRVATHSEVDQMLTNFFGSDPATQFSINHTDRERWFDLFGITYAGTTGSDWYAGGWYEKDNGMVDVVGYHNNGYFYSDTYANSTHNNFRGSGYQSLGIYLVSDGGLTYSSIQDPSINANNENAPESVPLGSSISLLILSMIGLRRKFLK